VQGIDHWALSQEIRQRSSIGTTIAGIGEEEISVFGADEPIASSEAPPAGHNGE
jgi:hypothetical protein